MHTDTLAQYPEAGMAGGVGVGVDVRARVHDADAGGGREGGWQARVRCLARASARLQAHVVLHAEGGLSACRVLCFWRRGGGNGRAGVACT